MSVSLFQLLERSLDASSLRQQAISNNLANAATPNYRPQRVVFESLLKEAMASGPAFEGKRTDPRHLAIGRAGQVIPAPQLTQEPMMVGSNGNGVDMDYEMSALARNSLWYQALAQQMNHEFNQLKIAIKGRV